MLCHSGLSGILPYFQKDCRRPRIKCGVAAMTGLLVFNWRVNSQQSKSGPRYDCPSGKADVVKSLSAKIPCSSPDHPLPCLLISQARQATGAEHPEMSHHRIGKALNHICLPGDSVAISKASRHFVPPFHATAESIHSTFFQDGSGSYFLIFPARRAVSGPRSFW